MFEPHKMVASTLMYSTRAVDMGAYQGQRGHSPHLPCKVWQMLWDEAEASASTAEHPYCDTFPPSADDVSSPALCGASLAYAANASMSRLVYKFPTAPEDGKITFTADDLPLTDPRLVCVVVNDVRYEASSLAPLGSSPDTTVSLQVSGDGPHLVQVFSFQPDGAEESGAYGMIADHAGTQAAVGSPC